MNHSTTLTRAQQMVAALTPLVSALEAAQLACVNADLERSDYIAQNPHLTYGHGNIPQPLKSKMAGCDAAKLGMEKAASQLREAMQDVPAFIGEVFEPLLEQRKTAAIARALPYCDGNATDAERKGLSDISVTSIQDVVNLKGEVMGSGFPLRAAKLFLVHLNEWIASQAQPQAQ